MGAGSTKARNSVISHRDFDHATIKNLRLPSNPARVQPTDKINSLFKFYSSFGNGKVSEGVAIQENKRRYAIKTTKQSKLGDLDSYLNVELPMLTEINHQHILKHHMAYYDDKQIYTVMEPCDGGTVKSRMQELGDISEKMVMTVIEKVLQALKYLHEHGIAHRNICPEIILFKGKNEGGELRVGGFGHAKYFGEAENFELRGPMGRVSYSAPEVFKGTYNEKCDLFSLGVLLFVLLSEAYPFEMENTKALKKNIQKCKYDMTKGKWKKISKEAKDLVKNLLEKDPMRRFSATQALDHPWFKKSKEDEKRLEA